MEITRETDYAIRCVLYLSKNHGKVSVVDDIAKEMCIPKSFLSKILQKLAKADIVRSYRGIKGGFRLTKSPKKINLLEVIQAIEGHVALNRCTVNRDICSLSSKCSVHPVWVELRIDIEKKLKRISFAKLVRSEAFH